MLDVLISGKLLRDPVTRTGPSGKPYCTALVRVPTEKEESLVASIIGFGDVAEKLGRLKAGDAVSVAGSAKLNSWEKNGETHHGLSITASAILSPYDARKRRSDTDAAPAGERRATGGRNGANGSRPVAGHGNANGQGGAVPFDDALPPWD